MPRMTGARFIAETLHGYEVTHFFFVPSTLNRALVEMETLGIKRIVTHGEKAAAYMADGYARACHRPGLCSAQSVGAANLAAGLQDAYLASSPVIAFSGQRAPIQRYRHAYQEILHTQMFDPVTKYNVVVETTEQLPFVLRQAFREVTSGNPAPAHIELQGIRGEDTIDKEADLEVIIENDFMKYPAFRPEPDPDKVSAIAKVISGAKKPIIVAGGGAVASGAGKEVMKLAEMISAPVVTSLSGKGIIPESHHLALGVVGAYSRSCANKAVAEADLVIFIGTRTGSMTTNDWKIPRPGTPVVQIDIDPSELGRSYPARAAVVGDVRVTLVKLNQVIKQIPVKEDWLTRARALLKEWRDELSPRYNSNAAPIRPERMCKELTEYLPDNAILMADTGHAATWTGTLVDLKYPGQTFIRSAGSLGWAFPAALGAKCAAPDRPVIAFTGDGGFWYHIGELETAARWNIPAVIVVNNNHSLNQTKRGTMNSYAGRQGDSDILWHFKDIDFAKLAELTGCLGIRVSKASELRSALEKAVESKKPCVVDVVGDIDGIAPPPWG